jgi:hypothetical protein
MDTIINVDGTYYKLAGCAEGDDPPSTACCNGCAFEGAPKCPHALDDMSIVCETIVYSGILYNMDQLGADIKIASGEVAVVDASVQLTL